MEITFENCEASNDNFWQNVKTLDPLYKLNLMMMILESYYKLNDNKNPKDLELDLRKHNLDVGLIAAKVKNDKTYQDIINRGKGIVIKRKYRHLYNKISENNINPDHIAEYYTMISCRPRKYVIEETLSHNESIEDNLNKLEEAGDMVVFNNDVPEGDVRVEQTDETDLLQEGKKKIVIKKVSYEEIFKKTYEKYPNAKPAVYSMLSDGSPLYVLVDNNQIVCPIGMSPYTENNEQKVKYFPIS